jgi:hypothetical protein
MSSGIVGAVFAALLAAGPAPKSGAVVASADDPGLRDALAASGIPGLPRDVFSALPPVDVSPDVLLHALPQAPEVVARKTRYYGTVTIDHRAHLERRASCRSCHGPGPVSRIEFTPKLAHERCVGCHSEEHRGPRDCKGCHASSAEAPIVAERPAERSSEEKAGQPEIRAPGPGKALTAAPAAAPGGGPGPGAGPAPSAPAPAAAPGGPGPGAALAASAPVVTSSATPLEDDGTPPRFLRIAQVGFAGGTEFGPSVRLAARQERGALEYSFEHLEGDGKTRSLVLVGGGLAYPLEQRLELVVIGVCGLDALERPETAFMGAVGARVGLEWLPRRWFVHSVNLSLTGVVDVVNRRAMGLNAGGTNFFVTLGTGFVFTHR